MPPRKPILPKNYTQGIKKPFKNIKLYLGLNMIKGMIGPHNLEEFLTLRCC